MRRQPPATVGSQAPHVQLAPQRTTPQESPLGHPRVSPGAHAPPPLHEPASVHAPHEHDAPHDRVCVLVPRPQLPQATVRDSVAPAVHSPLAEQALHAGSSQRQSSPQVRVRVRVPPQLPQGSLSGEVAPRAHSPMLAHVHAPQLQSSWQVRRCVPQFVQEPPVSTAPAMHAPSLVHAPSTQRPPSQVCCMRPHLPQLAVRAGVPGSQSQLVGASHAAQTPSVQRSTPPPHPLVQGRSFVGPTVASKSSQSRERGMPSSSASMSATQAPSTQANPSEQAGSQTRAGASRPASRGWTGG